MTLDEIIEKVAKLPASLHVRPLGVTTDDLKLLANHAKALAEAVEALRRIVERAGSYRDSDISAEALQAISRIKEGRG
jgi:hypothetical protein